MIEFLINRCFALAELKLEDHTYYASFPVDPASGGADMP
jgi:hypothetical protein